MIEKQQDAVLICARGLGMLLDAEDISLLGLSLAPAFRSKTNRSLVSMKGNIKIGLGFAFVFRWRMSCGGL